MEDAIVEQDDGSSRAVERSRSTLVPDRLLVLGALPYDVVLPAG